MNTSKTHARSLKCTLSIIGLSAFSVVTGCASSITPLEMMEDDVAQIIQEDNSSVDAQAGEIDVNNGVVAALNNAVMSSDTYRSALAAERQALSGIDVAESARRLQVNGSFMAGVVRADERGDQLEAGGSAQVNVSRLIYDGGASAAAINQATAQAIIARSNRENVANEIALEAARAWLDVWQYQERLYLLNVRTSEMEELLSQIERMAHNGMLDRAMLEDARRQVVTINLEESRLQASLGEAEIRFSRFFRTTAGRLVRPSEVISISMAREEARAWQQAPALQRAAAEVIVAQNELSAAEAAFRPRASIQAIASSPMDEDEETDASIGLSLQYTFGDGGRRRAEFDSAVSRLEAARAQLSALQSSLDADIQAAINQLDAIQRAMPLLNENIRLAEASAETARSQIATGQSNLRQLVDAEIESYRSSDELIEIRAERLLLQFTIAARTGALARSIGLVSPSRN